jgi:methylmalonic aciduria homocystinuria type C protein
MRQAFAMLEAHGFDLVHAFDLAIVADDDTFAMIFPGAQHDERRLGVLIGNTRALWPAFVAALRADPALAAARDPLDTYTERVLGAAFPNAPIAFGHRRYGATKQFVPMQRLAERAGLAARAPIGLCVHVTYGPWFALRGVVTLTGDPPPRVTPSVTLAPPLPCPPTHCARVCTAALDHAMSLKPDDDSWRAWLAVRDSCVVGRDHRYGEAQLRYHYTKDRSVLRPPRR